jgi:hypothetical protein
MRFDKMRVQSRSYQSRFLHNMRDVMNGEVNFDFSSSFNISDNYPEIIKACKKLVDKPTRINMKIETFDKKF